MSITGSNSTAQNMSRADLASALGVHYQTVGYLERGEYKPSLIIALKAADLFSVPVEEIFSLTKFAGAQT